MSKGTSSVFRVAVVDDEQSLLNVFASMLKQFDYHADLFRDPHEAFNAIISNPGRYRLVISDIRMDGMDGFAFCKLIRGVFPEMPFIFMTGFATPEIEEQAEAMGGIEVMMKPFPLLSVLEETIQRLTKRS